MEKKISTTTTAELRNREINVKKQIHFVTVRIENRREHFVEIDFFFFFSTLQCCFKFFLHSEDRKQRACYFFQKREKNKANRKRTIYILYIPICILYTRR